MIKIGIECRKEISKNGNFKIYESFYESVIGAVRALTEVNSSINSYKRDWDYKEEMKLLIRRVKDKNIKEELDTKYGPLQRHGQMKFKWFDDKKFQENYHLMFFKFKILVFEIDTNWYLNTTMSNLVYRESIDMAKTISGYDETSKISTIKVFDDDMSVNKDKSFNIIAPQKLRDDLKDFINSAITRTTKFHENHNFDTSVPKYDPFDIDSFTPMCGRCELLIFGLLFRGYYCKTCNKYYHQHCFENEEVEKIGKNYIKKFNS